MRGQLVWVQDGEFDWRDATEEDIARFFDATIEEVRAMPDSTKSHFSQFFDTQGNLKLSSKVSHEIKPSIIMESSRFRNLLKNLGFKVTLWWKAKLVTRNGESHKSTRFFELDHADIEALGKRTVEQFNSLSGTKNTDKEA